VLAVLLSLTAAVGYGISDFTAGLASRQASVILITFWSALCSSVLVLAVLACAPGRRRPPTRL
jgi:drug/metabolite transporter (DMT)-like permease